MDEKLRLFPQSLALLKAKDTQIVKCLDHAANLYPNRKDKIPKSLKFNVPAR